MPMNTGIPEWAMAAERVSYQPNFTNSFLQPLGGKQAQWNSMRSVIPVIEGPMYPSQLGNIPVPPGFENPFTNIRRQAQQDYYNWNRELATMPRPSVTSQFSNFILQNQNLLLLGAVGLLAISVVRGR